MPINPGLAGLLAFGGGLAAAGGPSRMPTGMGQALGQGAQSGLAGYMQAQQMAQQNRSADLETMELMLRQKALQQQQQQDAAQKQALQQYASTIEDPKQRALLMLDPGAYVKSRISAGAPKPPTVETFYEGGQEVQKQWDPEKREWVELGRGARWKPEQAGDEDPMFGRGMTGQAYEILTRNHLKRQQGMPLTPEEEAQEQAARRIIETPKASIDPQTGALTTITPVAPFAQQQAAQAGAQQPQAAGGPAPAAGGSESVRVERTGTPQLKAKQESIYNTIGNILDIIEQPGEAETGVSGFVGRYTNPIARQMGFPAGTGAEELSGAYSLLTNQVGELITSGVLSDQDVRRLENAIGKVSLWEDEAILKKKLANIVEMLEGMSGADGG